MKAAVYRKYGPPDVVKVKDIARPVPEADEILVKVHASTVSAGDSRMRSFDVPPMEWLFARVYLGIRKPRRPVLGMQLAGEVRAVGADVSRFRVGDRVFGSTFSSGFGGHAQYKCLKEDGVVALMPENMTYEEAAAVPIPGIGAWTMLNKANILPDQSVLIYGAFRRSRHLRRTDRALLRRRGDRRLPRRQPSDGEIAGRP